MPEAWARATRAQSQREPQVERRLRVTFPQADLLLPALDGCEIDRVPNMHSEWKTLARYQGLARRTHPISPRALRRQGRPSECARESRGSCFLFLIREFQLVAVSPADYALNSLTDTNGRVRNFNACLCIFVRLSAKSNNPLQME